LGIDARNGRVSVEGWTKQTEVSPLELAKKYEKVGLWAIIYTDILRDGMGSGPNVEATKSLAEGVGVPVIASGGISDLNDVARLLTLSKFGVIGMITGRALYKGTLDLTEAIRLVKQKN
jgi:phosphoribosylformimino-5-aminoimidazole carboxamide ribotide isomerase